MNQGALILVIGLPGTGKTTFARSLATKLNAKHLNSDIIREFIGKRGQYDAESKSEIYHEMLAKTEGYLQHEMKVIVDATFYKDSLRIAYQRLGEKYGVPIKWIELKTNEKEIKKRVSKKRKYSEADFEVYLKIKNQYEPLKQKHLELSSDSLTIEEMLNKAVEYLNFEEKNQSEYG